MRSAGGILNSAGVNITTLHIRNIEKNFREDLGSYDAAKILQDLKREYFYSDFFCEYSKKYFNSDKQLSFYVHNNKSILAVVLIHPIDQNKCTYFGLPVRLFLAENISIEAQKNIRGLCKTHLEEIMQKNNLKELVLDLDSSLGTDYYQAGNAIDYNIDAIIDLKQTPEEIKLGVRKSYKSLINWGQKNLSVDIIDEKSGNKEQFDHFRELHITVAGRETRSKESWDCQFDWIKSGHGFVVLAKLQGELVSGVMNLYGTDEVYYGVGVNRRDLMAKKIAIGHYPIWLSILEAQKRNLKIYNLGSIGPNFHSDKERDIALFKKGFSSQIRISHSLKVELAKTENASEQEA